MIDEEWARDWRLGTVEDLLPQGMRRAGGIAVATDPLAPIPATCPWSLLPKVIIEL